MFTRPQRFIKFSPKDSVISPSTGLSLEYNFRGKDPFLKCFLYIILPEANIWGEGGIERRTQLSTPN